MSSRPWLAILPDGRLVRWSDAPPYVDGDDTLAPTVLARLNGAGTIALTPAGPFVDLDPADPLAVLAVLREIDPRVRSSRDSPRAGAIAADATS